MLKEAWGKVKPETIVRCWLKSRALPVQMEAALRSEHDPPRHAQPLPADRDTLDALAEKFAEVVTVSKTFPLRKASEASAYSQAGRLRGKIALKVR